MKESLPGLMLHACLVSLEQLVAKADSLRWSLYGALWLQPVAICGKSTRPVKPENKPNRCHQLPPVAFGIPW
jgi:hypothetical protein